MTAKYPYKIALYISAKTQKGIEQIARLGGIPRSMVMRTILEDYFRGVKRKKKTDTCDHDWVDATNEVIKGGLYCPKCHAVKADEGGD